jgi:hypothetical protein
LLKSRGNKKDEKDLFELPPLPENSLIETNLDSEDSDDEAEHYKEELLR